MVAVAYVVGCVFAGLSGALLATQSGINSTLGAAVGKSFAAVVSFAVGLGALLVFFAIDTAGLGHKGPSLEAAAGEEGKGGRAWGSLYQFQIKQDTQPAHRARRRFGLNRYLGRP